MRYLFHVLFILAVAGCGPVSCLASDVETKMVTRCSTFEKKDEMINRFSTDSMLMYLSDGWRMQPEHTTFFYNDQAREVCIRRMFTRPKSLF